MSKISTVYSSLVSEVGGLFSTKTRLHNAYELDENPDPVKKNAWGLKTEPAQNVVTEFCNLSLERVFTVVLVRQFVSLVGKEDGFDAVTVGLLEDQQSLVMMLVSPNELGQESLIDKIDVTNVSGIQEMTSGEKKYLFSEVTFTILISELIS